MLSSSTKGKVRNTSVAGGENENKGVFYFFKIREIVACFYAVGSDSLMKDN